MSDKLPDALFVYECNIEEGRGVCCAKLADDGYMFKFYKAGNETFVRLSAEGFEALVSVMIAVIAHEQNKSP